jgi:signal transduction histidine kinase/DNA-binding response OmpR family regulator
MVNDRAAILVVDDDKLIAGFLNDLLIEAGYDVRLVHTGQDALDRLDAAAPDEIDLVLLDVMLPDVDGYTVCRRLRSAPHTERLLVIMVTGRDTPAEKTRGLDIGADDYIAKPFDPQELLARVRSMLRLHRAEQDLRTRHQALAALNAVSQTIGRAVELPDVLRSALDQVLDSLALPAGLITLRSAGGHQVAAVQRWPAHVDPPNILLAEQAAQTGEAVVVDRTACVPLISRNHVLGVLAVTGLTRAGPDTLDLLSAIGSQIGAAIERARLYQDAQQRSEDLAVLNEITRAVTSSLELDRVLTTSLHSIRQILHVEAGSLVLLDAESGELHFRNTLPALEDWIRRDAAQAGGGIISAVTALREPLIVKEAELLHGAGGEPGARAPAEPPAWEPAPQPGSDRLNLRNLLAVPLIVKSQVRGVIVVINRSGGAFTSDDLELLQFLAGAVAVAAENARLYGELADFARELERSQAQLIQAEKLAATGRLAASLAHEINNPLQAIHNCLHLVVNRSLTDEKKKYYLGLAQAEVDRLITLVQRALEFYRPSQGRPAATDVNRLIENVLALSNKRLEHGRVQVRAQLQPDLAPLTAVPDQLTQVFLNLIINAVEAMPEGGTLTIRSALRDSQLAIEVQDTGPGLTPDESARIFEPFYTTKAGGTGLGLAVSYGIIQQHGGRIEVQSAPAQGTTFTVWLPLQRGAADE